MTEHVADTRPAIVRFVENVHRAIGGSSQVAPDNPPPEMGEHERAQLSAAARRARSVYPGPVGELIDREIRAYLEFGYQFEHGALMERLAATVLAAEYRAGSEGNPPATIHHAGDPVTAAGHDGPPGAARVTR